MSGETVSSRFDFFVPEIYLKGDAMRVFCIAVLLASMSFLASASGSPQGDFSQVIKAEIAAIEKGLGPSVRIKGTEPVRFTLVERMKHFRVPGVSIAVVRHGEVRWAKGYGIANSDSGTQSRHPNALSSRLD